MSSLSRYPRRVRGTVLRPLATALLLVGLSFRATPALAGDPAASASPAPSPDDAAREAERAALYKEGTELAGKEQWAGAVERFRKVAALRESPRVLFTLGQAEEKVGRRATAKKTYERAAALAKAASDKEAETAAQQALSNVAPHVGQLRWSAPESAGEVSVRVDGVPVPGRSVELDAGTHHLDAGAPGKLAFSIDVQIEDDQMRDVAIVLSDAPHVPPAEPSSAASAAAVPLPPGTTSALPPLASTTARPGPEVATKIPPLPAADHTWIGALLLGTGVLGGALGGGALGLSLDDVAEANRAFEAGDKASHGAAVDRANAKQWVGGVALGAGVVAMGIGLIVLLASPTKVPPARSSSPDHSPGNLRRVAREAWGGANLPGSKGSAWGSVGLPHQPRRSPCRRQIVSLLLTWMSILDVRSR